MHGIEKELGRPVYGLAENLFRSVPVVGTLWARGGGVAAHPDNAYRLLHDEGQLVLVFPEGTKATGKRFTERYQLHRFGRGGFVEIAMRAGVPVIPIAVVGAEESMPIVFKSSRLAKVLGLPYFPVTAEHVDDRARSGSSGTCPPKFRLRVLPPVLLRRRARSGALLAQPGDGRVGTHPRDRCRKRSTTCCARAAACGSDRRTRAASLVTGLVARTGAVGSRRSSSGDPTSRSSSASTPATRGSRSSAPSSCAPTRRTRSSPASCAATQVDTIVHTHLIVDSTRASGRTLHEINVIGTMNLLAAAGASGSPVRKVVLKSSGLVYGAAKTDPYFFREEMTRTSAPTTQRGAIAARGRGVPARLRRRQPARRTSRCSASRTCSATTSTRRSRSRCADRSCPRSSASIRGCSSCTKTTSSAR